MPFLSYHNCFSILPTCSGCRDEAQAERITWKAEIQWTEAVSNGPVLELHLDSEKEEPKELKN